jgi:hypothetical protein
MYRVVRRSALIALCAGVLLLACSGATRVEAFWFRIPAIHIPHFSVPHVTVPHVAVPAVRVPHLAVPAARLPSMPHVAAPTVRVPHLAAGAHAAPHLPYRTAGAGASNPAPGLNRGISLARKVSPGGTGQPATRQVSAGSTSRSSGGGQQSGGWTGCHGHGGVWGGGDCGRPDIPPAPPRWTYVTVPPIDTASNAPVAPAPPADQVPSAPGPFASIPLAPSTARVNPGASVASAPPRSPPPPPDPSSMPQQSSATGCKGAPPGTPTFGYRVNPDSPALECGTQGQDVPAPGPFASLSLAPPPREPSGPTDAVVHHDPPSPQKVRQKQSQKILCNDRQGEVSVYITDFGFDRLNRDNIVMRFDGAGARDFHWVQFVWREKLVTKRVRFGDATASMTLPADDFYTRDLGGGEKRRFTRDSKNPNYYVDARRPGLREKAPDHGPLVDPNIRAEPMYYEDPKLRNRNSVEMIDLPTGMFCPQASQKDTIKVVSRAHFDTFLVSNGKTCARISWNVEHEWKKEFGEACDPHDPSFTKSLFMLDNPRYEILGIDISGAPPKKEQMDILKFTFPGQAAIK